ncbi:MAG: hypothetical protein P9X26_04950 [Candidatus Stygibacter frigidus]|nr:hypothetical protein [Candidatus Stygibacter frigidus]
MRRSIILVIMILSIMPLMSWDIQHGIYISSQYLRSSEHDQGDFYLEYYPSVQKQFLQSGNITLDSNLELMSRGEAKVINNDVESACEFDVYRFWLRSSAEQSEFRIGLQKINFGPARYLRSLQWFDRIDPLDPRQQTEGVWGMLMRYYSLDNSNYWFWVLYDESELKGAELVESRDKSIEMGGRLQLSILGGDIGFSYHNRGVKNPGIDARESELFVDSEERRFGFDGSWDIGIGLWQETSISIYDGVDNLPLYAEFYTLGADYTFELGNGLHILAEHQYIRTEDRFWDKTGEQKNMSLLTADYPIGLYDSIMGLVSYDHQDENMYYYLSYTRVYDYVSLYFNLSYKPEGVQDDTYRMKSSETALQILLQLNY